MAEMPPPSFVERAVRERYAHAAQKQETALCCPVEYDCAF
jgi:hypothetical protein